MKKNIPISSASPRKNGKSDILCDEFARGVVCGAGAYEKGEVRDLPAMNESCAAGRNA